MILNKIDRKNIHSKLEYAMEDKAMPRQTMPATISLSDGRSVSGEIQIDLDMRLSDFMNLPVRFIVIKDKDGAFKLINKDHIVDIRLK